MKKCIKAVCAFTAAALMVGMLASCNSTGAGSRDVSSNTDLPVGDNTTVSTPPFDNTTSVGDDVSSRTRQPSSVVKPKPTPTNSSKPAGPEKPAAENPEDTYGVSVLKDSNSSSRRSQLIRRLANGFTQVEKKLNGDWVYPADGDYPYRDFDSIATVLHVDSKHKIYTFLRGESANVKPYFEEYPEVNMPPSFADANGVSYAMTYDLVLESGGDKDNADYLALFKGKGLDFATGITPLTPTADNSTVFSQKQMTFNVNVTNLTDDHLQFSVRYDIKDYYGKVCEAGIFINSDVFKNKDANRHIVFTAQQYGMYYIDLLVVTKYSSYREMYPFAVIPDYTYKHNATSPFGIVHILVGPYEPFHNSINLANRIGVANTRLGISNIEGERNITDTIAAAEDYKSRGIRLNGMHLYWSVPTDANAYKALIDANLARYGKYLDSCEVGNENNLESIIDGDKDIGALFDNFKKNVFDPGYEIVKQKYKIPYLASAISAGQSEWYDQMYQKGIWDKFDIISLHPYGFPYAPDSKAGNGGVWHVESALKRHKAALDRYGYKRTYITEIGVASIPGSKREVDLRTQADYTLRNFALGLAYGAERVQMYSFFDSANTLKGFNKNDMEWHFGAFYAPDYYGRIMPKPAAAAFSTMTRLLESVTSVSETAYSAGTVRSFFADTKDRGKVMVAWSNIAPQRNDTSTHTLRDIALPWKNLWSKTEKVVFDAVGNIVTVTDSMGNAREYTPNNGEVAIELSGSPVFIEGVE